ncbi:MAG: RidA family protein, partial [Saprospiraceae bacterium]|nr:RidA family protein [Saprospiraceae bacterium]
MKKIFTEKAPAPGGHYSQATKQAGFIFVSGQLPINPETGEKIFGNIEMQTSQVLKNMLAIVEAAGANLEDIMKVTVYISDIELWAE